MKMRTALIGTVTSLVLAIALGGTTALAADDTDAQQQAAIAKKAQAFVDAFQKGDANAVAAFWAPDGDYSDIGGRLLKGRKAIADDFADLFAQNKGLTLRIEIGSIRFPTPDTAI